MINIKSISVAALLLGAALLPLSAVAQTQGQGRGQGGQGRGGMQFGRNGGMQSKGFLAMRNDVRKDIKTTADQNAKIDKAAEEMKAAMPQFGGGAGGGGGQRQGGGGGGQAGGGQAGGERPDMQAMQEKIQAAMKKFDEDVLKALDDTQKTRLDQISLQMQGNRALMQKELQEKLGFTKEQTRKVEDLQESMNTANQAIFQRMQNGEIDRSEIQPLMEENNKILDGELAKVLTAEQTKKFDDMKGPKFTRDPKDDEAARSIFGGGRGGRGGGGGN